DREAGDVRGLQVGCALDPGRDGVLDRAPDRAGEDGLRRAGDVLEEHVAAREERREDEPDLLRLTVDDRLDVVEQAPDDRRGPGCFRAQKPPLTTLVRRIVAAG